MYMHQIDQIDFMHGDCVVLMFLVFGHIEVHGSELYLYAVFHARTTCYVGLFMSPERVQRMHCHYFHLERAIILIHRVMFKANSSVHAIRWPYCFLGWRTTVVSIVMQWGRGAQACVVASWADKPELQSTAGGVRDGRGCTHKVLVRLKLLLIRKSFPQFAVPGI